MIIKKQSLSYAVNTFALIILVAQLSLPVNASAQNYYGREGQSPWSGMGGWNGYGHSNAFDTKINNLDKNKVIDLPVPVLFGITPDNLTRNFGDPRSGGRTHEGLDIMAPKDAPIVTPTDAVVMRVGTGVDAGNYVYTANPGGETFAYLHLSEMANIREGDEIKKGALIGYVGNTGNASGGSTHLHFEIRDANGYIDPFTRLTRIFPLAEKIQYLQTILSNSADQNKLIENVATLYRKELLQAQTLNIPLPASLATALANKVAVEVATSQSRTLKLGSKGEDVKLLQALLGLPADGSFGPKTKVAVIAFQASKGLTADGVFGPKSRLALIAGNTLTIPAGCSSSAGYSVTTGVKCTTTL